MKGVLTRLCSDPICCIDLSHEIPSFSIKTASWILARSLLHMPDPAIWLCVVDPGVGSMRRALVVQCGDSFFLGPDNGLLTPLLKRQSCRVLALRNTLFSSVSSTFHGRDLFAPAAAWLSGGESPENLCEEISDPVILSDSDFVGWQRTASGWSAEVMHVDRFGNLVTALPGSEVMGRRITGFMTGVSCGRLAHTFSDFPKGGSGLVVGGFGTVEVVVNQGTASRRFNGKIGSIVTIIVHK